MADAVLTFTFAPVQPFITESRRAADLFAGSAILVQLARAAAEEILRTKGTLVYPAPAAVKNVPTAEAAAIADTPFMDVTGKLGEDIPNKLVAIVPQDQAATIAEQTHRKLIEEWQRLARGAWTALIGSTPTDDPDLNRIWKRQTERYWEVFWAAAPLNSNDLSGYREAYESSQHAIEAIKRTRAFAPSEEGGYKDTLSGRREALHTATLDAPAFWSSIADRRSITNAKLRPGGKERLDALGSVKRFGRPAKGARFESTSSVAAADFLYRAVNRPPEQLTNLRSAVAKLFAAVPSQGWNGKVTNYDQWPYDGAFLFAETYTAKRLADDSGLVGLDDETIKHALESLKSLQRAVGGAPSPYFGVVVFDGDNMGQTISKLLDNRSTDPHIAHIEFSDKLSTFAGLVPKTVSSNGGTPIYSGGDDVLFLAPLPSVLGIARTLATAFESTTGATASAGIAIVHHLSPLDAALRSAREAERRAKEVPEKNAVCIRVERRSGELVEMRARWKALKIRAEALGLGVDDRREEAEGLSDQLVALFRRSSPSREAQLSGRFATDLKRAAYAIGTADCRFESELRLLLKRHYQPEGCDKEEAVKRREQLHAALLEFAKSLPAVRINAWSGADTGGPVDNLANWVSFARFVAQGGGE